MDRGTPVHKGELGGRVGSAGVLCGESKMDTGGGRNRKGLVEQNTEQHWVL